MPAPKDAQARLPSAASEALGRLARRCDEHEIRRVIEDWLIWRDTGEFDRFADLWHPDGWMVATWFQASASDFVARTRKTFVQAGRKGLHSLGGTCVDVAGERAIAQTRMHIQTHAQIHGVEVEVVCSGRFFDFFEKFGGAWKLLHRQPIYELDRLTPLTCGAPLSLDADLLDRFPEGYRHLAYVQSRAGLDVANDLPGTRGCQVERLVARGRLWLDRSDVDLRSPLN